MDRRKLYSVVKKHIDKIDYYALLAGGAPEDEFDIESRIISKNINEQSTVLEIAETIARVFEENFDNLETAENFMDVAVNIKNDIK